MAGRRAACAGQRAVRARECNEQRVAGAWQVAHRGLEANHEGGGFHAGQRLRHVSCRPVLDAQLKMRGPGRLVSIGLGQRRRRTCWRYCWRLPLPPGFLFANGLTGGPRAGAPAGAPRGIAPADGPAARCANCAVTRLRRSPKGSSSDGQVDVRSAVL